MADRSKRPHLRRSRGLDDRIRDKDPFLADRGFDKEFQERFPGARNQPHTTTTNASHFLQEDKTTELATNITNWLTQTGFTDHALA